MTCVVHSIPCGWNSSKNSFLQQRYLMKWGCCFINVSMEMGAGSGREYWIIYRGPGFLAVVWYGSFPTPIPPLSRQKARPGRLRKRDYSILADRWEGEGVGEEPNQARKPGPLQIIQYSLGVWIPWQTATVHVKSYLNSIFKFLIFFLVIQRSLEGRIS